MCRLSRACAHCSNCFSSFGSRLDTIQNCHSIISSVKMSSFNVILYVWISKLHKILFMSGFCSFLFFSATFRCFINRVRRRHIKERDCFSHSIDMSCLHKQIAITHRCNYTTTHLKCYDFQMRSQSFYEKWRKTK